MIGRVPVGDVVHLMSPVRQFAMQGGFWRLFRCLDLVNLGFIDPACVTHITTRQFQAMKGWS